VAPPKLEPGILRDAPVNFSMVTPRVSREAVAGTPARQTHEYGAVRGSPMKKGSRGSSPMDRTWYDMTQQQGRRALSGRLDDDPVNVGQGACSLVTTLRPPMEPVSVVPGACSRSVGSLGPPPRCPPRLAGTPAADGGTAIVGSALLPRHPTLAGTTAVEVAAAHVGRIVHDHDLRLHASMLQLP